MMVTWSIPFDNERKRSISKTKTQKNNAKSIYICNSFFHLFSQMSVQIKYSITSVILYYEIIENLGN
jgi:hypothetical protein